MRVEAVHGGYGQLDVLHGVNFRMAPGELVCIIGPNGAGKSTLLKAMVGLVRIRSGRVLLEDREITGLPPAQAVRLGICYVPQTGNVFPSLTVEENLEMGAYVVRDQSLEARKDRVFALFETLKEKRRHRAGALSGGQQQMVAIGRALMLDPRVLLLDEPTAGLSPLYTSMILERVRAINGQGVGVCLVEQNARAGLEIAHRGYVFTQGTERLEAPAERLLTDPGVGRLFLGGAS
ncbi:ABC transporter ATP-binding protein [Limnochorda pilosa]